MLIHKIIIYKKDGKHWMAGEIGERTITEDNSTQRRPMLKAKTAILLKEICGNILLSTGAALVSCYGVTLPPEETENAAYVCRRIYSIFGYVSI